MEGFMKYIILDTETTDLEGDVVQMAIMVLDENFKVESFESFYCDTDRLVSQKAFEIHGISNEIASELSGGKYLEDYLLGDDRYKELFFSPGTVFVGFNVLFDLKAINRVLMERTGLSFSMPLQCKSIFTLDPNRRYYLDMMQYYRQKTGMIKGLNLAKAVELAVKDVDVDGFYKRVAEHFKIKAGHNFHDAAYDTYCTMLLLFEYGKDVC